MAGPRDPWRAIELGVGSGNRTVVVYDTRRTHVLIHSGPVRRVLAARLRTDGWHRFGPYCDGEIWYRPTGHPRRRPRRRVVVAAIDLSPPSWGERPPMTEPTGAVDRVLASARLDGLPDPDPEFVELLRAYANGDIERTAFEARVADAVVAAVAPDPSQDTLS